VSPIVTHKNYFNLEVSCPTDRKPLSPSDTKLWVSALHSIEKICLHPCFVT